MVEGPVPWTVSFVPWRFRSFGGFSGLRAGRGDHGADFPDDLLDEFCGVSKVALVLDVQPESGRLAEVASEAEGRVERDGPASVDDFVDAARWDADGSGEGILREAHRCHVIFEEDFSR